MTPARCLIAALFVSVAGLVAGQPVPCEVQGRAIDTPAPTLAIVVDKTDVATAKANREVIEQALRGGGTVNLPGGLVAVDRGVRLPSGSTLAGAGPKTILRNVATPAPFGDNCTIQIHPQYNDAGIGYADHFTRRQRSAITFADAAAANRYRTGGWLFTYKWDGYLPDKGGSAKTWVHRVAAESGNTITLNVEPQPGADTAVYTKSAVRVSGALEGRSQVKIAAGVPGIEFIPGRLVWITAGPTVGNECVGECRRITAVSSEAITLDRPLRSTYPYALSLAVILNPVQNVTVRDLTLGMPTNGQAPPCFFERADGLTLQRLNVEGQIDVVLSSNVRIYDCTSTSSLKLNATRDCLVSGGRCLNVFIEEACADCTLTNLLVNAQKTKDLAGINAVSGSPSERIAVRDCIIEQSTDMPIHLVGRECVVENLTVRNSANPVAWVNSYIGGDGTRIDGLTSDLTTVFRSGRGVVAANVRTPLFLGWYEPGDQPVGVCVACPKLDTYFLTPATLSQWAISTASVE